MGLLKLDGSLTGGPPTVSDSTFPGASFLVGLSFAQGHDKQFGVASGVLTRLLATGTNAYVTLRGVGADDAVVQGNALYFKCSSPMKLRVTFVDPLNPSVDIVSVIPVVGPLVLEAPDDSYIKLLECTGSGPVEYLVAGNV